MQVLTYNETLMYDGKWMNKDVYTNSEDRRDIVIIDDNFVSRFTIEQLLKYYSVRNDIPIRIYTSGDWLQGVGYLLVKLPSTLILSSTFPKYSLKEVVYFITSNPALNDSQYDKIILDHDRGPLPPEYLELKRSDDQMLPRIIDKIFNIRPEKRSWRISLGRLAIHNDKKARERSFSTSWYFKLISHLALLTLAVSTGYFWRGENSEGITRYQIFGKEIGNILSPILGATLILIMQVSLFTASTLFVFRNNSELSSASGQTHAVVFDTFSNSSSNPSIGIDFSDTSLIKLQFNPNQHSNEIILNGGTFSSTNHDSSLPEPGVRLNDNYFYKFDSTTPGYHNGRVTQVHQLSSGTFLVLTMSNGFFHFDNQGNLDSEDDQFTLLYSPSSTVAVSSNLSAFDIDEETGLIYLVESIGFSRSRISIIDTKKTYTDSTDDTLEGNHEWSSPDVFLEKVHGVTQISYENGSGILYVLGTFGLVRIDTSGTATTSDDLYLGIWGNEDLPAIALSETSANDFYQRGRYIYLLSGYRNINVIDTQNTPTVSDDAVVYSHTRAALGFGELDMVHDIEHDYVNDLLYISAYGTNGGITVLDLKKTDDYSDDEILYKHTPTNLGITADRIGEGGSGASFYETVFHEKSGNLIIRNYSYAAVINRHSLTTPDDDEVLKYFPTLFLAQDYDVQILSHYTFDIFPDDNTGLLYISTTNSSFEQPAWWAVTFDPYVRGGSFISSTENVEQEIDPDLDHFLQLDTDIPPGDQITLSTRTGLASLTMDEFNDGDTSNVTDHYGWGNPFQSITESDGKLILSGLTSNWGAQWIIMPVDEPFAAGSSVIIKYRANTSATNFRFNLFTDEWSGGYGQSNDINQDIVLELTEASQFTHIGVYVEFTGGTWESGDSIEIESIKVIGTPTWGSWNQCQNTSSCLINYGGPDENFLQFSAFLSSSNGTTTPLIKNASLISGYANNGTYYSEIYDSGTNSDWQELQSNYSTPINTSVIYATRSGNSPTIDSSWSDWEEVNGSIRSKDARYIQFRADLSSESPASTPAVESVSIMYEPGTVTFTDNQTGTSDSSTSDSSSDGSDPSEGEEDSQTDDEVEEPEDKSDDEFDSDPEKGTGRESVQRDKSNRSRGTVQRWIEEIKVAISKNSDEISATATVASVSSIVAIILLNGNLLNLSIFELPYLLMTAVNDSFTIIGLKRKRRPIGYVYDAVSKGFIPSTIVRIYSEDNKLVETTVTDAFGVLNTRLVSGNYRLESRNRKYISPSRLVTNREDYPISNVYTGGKIYIDDSGELKMAIPMDPKDASSLTKLSSRIITRFRNGFFFLNIYVFIFALWLSLIAYAFSPNFITLIVLGLQIPTVALLVYSLKSKSNRFGRVKDQQGNLVNGVAVTLREINSGSVVSKRVSDSLGNLMFTVPAGKYLVELVNADYMLSDSSKSVVDVKGAGLHKVGIDMVVNRVNA